MAKNRRDKKLAEGEVWISKHPQYRKWINECIACYAKGYKSGMPSHHVRGYFNPLSVNEQGLCDQCAKAGQYTK